MSARRHGTQKQHSQGPANDFEDCIKCFVLAAKVLLDAKQWYADTPIRATCAGKTNGQDVQTVGAILIAWDTIHPEAQGQQRHIAAKNFFASLQKSSFIRWQVGQIGKLSMSVHWNIAWTTSRGKRKGSCTISSFCFLSKDICPVQRWPAGALSKASEQITRAIAIWSFVSSQVSDMVCPSSIGLCKQGMGALCCKVTTWKQIRQISAKALVRWQSARVIGQLLLRMHDVAAGESWQARTRAWTGAQSSRKNIEIDCKT